MAKSDRPTPRPPSPAIPGSRAASPPRSRPALEGLGYELVRVLVLGRERPTVQVMADRADGQQINVEDCERITHAICAVLDVDDPLPGAWTSRSAAPASTGR